MKSSRVIAGLMVAAAAAGGWAAESAPVLDYALTDQFGATHTDEDCGEAVVVLLGGDRKGSAYIDEWSSALGRAYARELQEGRVCAVGFAHLKGAPFFVKKRIVASFSKDPKAWTLLDWKGEIARAWGGEKDAANLYVFNRAGELVYSVSLKGFDQATFDRIVDVVIDLAAER